MYAHVVFVLDVVVAVAAAAVVVVVVVVIVVVGYPVTLRRVFR